MWKRLAAGRVWLCFRWEQALVGFYDRLNHDQALGLKIMEIHLRLISELNRITEVQSANPTLHGDGSMVCDYGILLKLSINWMVQAVCPFLDQPILSYP
jgi:hypothetical protein